MSSSLLALVNFAVFLLLLFPLAHAVARVHWTGRGVGSVVLWMLLAAQSWLVAQGLEIFVFGEGRMLYGLWFVDWMTLATAAALFPCALRGRGRYFFDAARMDGSGALAVFRQVVWPFLRAPLGIVAWILAMLTFLNWLVRPDAGATPRDLSGLPVVVALSFAAVLPHLGIFLLSRRAARS